MKSREKCVFVRNGYAQRNSHINNDTVTVTVRFSS